MVLGKNLRDREKSEISLWNQVLYHDMIDDTIDRTSLDFKLMENQKAMERYVIYKMFLSDSNHLKKAYIRLTLGIVIKNKNAWNLESVLVQKPD